MVGHDGDPALRIGRAGLESSGIHITVSVSKRPVDAWVSGAAEGIPVMPQTHVVAELVGEGQVVAVRTGKPDRAGRPCLAARGVAVATHKGQEMHEVGPDLVPDRMHFVQVAVRRVRQTPEVNVLVDFGIFDLSRGDQRDTLFHATVRVGLIRRGDHEVDHRLDLGDTAGVSACRRRIENRHVDQGHRGLRLSAGQPGGPEVRDRPQPCPKLRASGNTHSRARQIQCTQRLPVQLRRKGAGQSFVECEIHLVESGFAQSGGNRAAQPVAFEIQSAESVQDTSSNGSGPVRPFR